MNDRKRTRETIRYDSTSTTPAATLSLMSLYGPALCATRTISTSTLAAAGMLSPSVYLPGLLCPAASSRRDSTLKRARRMAPAHTKSPATKIPKRPKLVRPHL